MICPCDKSPDLVAPEVDYYDRYPKEAVPKRGRLWVREMNTYKLFRVTRSRLLVRAAFRSYYTSKEFQSAQQNHCDEFILAQIQDI